MRRLLKLKASIFFWLATAVALPVQAADTLTSVQPLAVIYATPEAIRYEVGQQNRVLQAGDRIKPEGRVISGVGRAVLRAYDGSEIKLMENSQIELRSLSFDQKKNKLDGELRALLGSVLLKIQHPRGRTNALRVAAGTTVVGVRGTDFLTEVDEELNARYSTHDGLIAIAGREKAEVTRGEGLFAPVTGKFTKVKLPSSPRHGTPAGQMYAPFGFEWEPVPGINRYQVTVAKDEEMNDVVFLGSVEASTKVTFDMFSPGKYYWQVQAIDDLGFASIAAKPVEFQLVR